MPRYYVIVFVCVAWHTHVYAAVPAIIGRRFRKIRISVHPSPACEIVDAFKLTIEIESTRLFASQVFPDISYHIIRNENIS